MKEGTADEMEQHITTMAQEARQQGLEVSVLKVMPRCFIKTLNQCPGVEEDAENEAWSKGQVRRVACSLAGWARGPRTRKAVGKHGNKRKLWLL